jgi:hypothetical protein
MNFNRLSFGIALISILFLSSCSTTGVNPTGLMGGQIACPTGARPAIDCRGVLQQYARDLKVDLDAMAKFKVGLGVTSTKMTEADALTSDLLQHSYQICTLYNACIMSPQDYATKSEKLQDVQLQVRRTLAGGLYGQQQNIQINPVPGVPGSQFPPQFPGGIPPPPFPGGAPPSPFPGGVGPAPGVPYSGAAPSPYPQMGATFPQPDPNFPQQGIVQGQPYPPQPPVGQNPFGNPPSGPTLSVNIPNTGSQIGDSILNILREGSKALRTTDSGPTQPGTAIPAPVKSASAAPAQDLDTALRSMLLALKQNVATQNPSLASGRAVVGNFTEENRPWSGPMGALLQDRVSAIVMTDGIFNQSTGIQSRGITVKEVAAVSNANDPRALTTLYNTDLAIAGTYQTQSDGIRVKLSALRNSGEVAQISKTIPANAIPDVVAATPQNAAETSQLLNSMNQIGPKADSKLNVTTNRPGAGSSFRLGEEIIYFAGSSSDGYLYLFHIDGDKNVTRIFPNQYQRDATIRAGQVLQVPAAGAPFKFEASPPFGLETTFAIVTPAPLAESDLQMIQASFASAKQVAPSILQARGIAVSPAGSSAPVAPSSSVLWNSVTVLVRP